MTESAINFSCGGAGLVGILHSPDKPRKRGVLMVVGGGPQYRAGGHRQLTLWSRRLCDEGFPVFRFDYRGMGDAHGGFQGFEDVDDDIQAAVDRFHEEVPEMDEIVLWGECDAASAILFYAGRDSRIKAAVLLNPWVRTESGEAKAILRHYYAKRLMQPSFWKKVLRLDFNVVASIGSAMKLVRQSASRATESTPATTKAIGARISRELPLPQRMLAGLAQLNGPVMLVLSGRDLIAREFDAMVAESPQWKQQFAAKPTTRHDLALSDHTFSSAAQRDDVVQRALSWLQGW
ncbi:hydrolase 1, exosortase A system-associated [Comamonadaceae bacterium G21597-S1]|nr:hydrolase 1, exosortase A system-associated [Comamonadaceae bacterium G21597-S1]